MEMHRTPRSRRLRVASALLVMLASAGCVPDVAWLPDSSGIIYTTTDWPGGFPDLPKEQNGRLIHYDLAKKTPRLIAKTDTRTIQPALSPDGKRIAMARLTLDKTQAATLQVVVYDLQGKEVHRSKTFEWGNKPEGEISIEKYLQLFWAPQANKVLVYANKTTGIYDLDKDQAVMLGTAVPSIYGTSPIRPDGKGFLIARENNQVSFVDWAGKEAAVKVPVDKLTGRLDGILSVPAAACWARWEGDVAIATWKGTQVRIDTAKRIGTWHELEESAWAFDGKEIQHLYAFPDGKTKIVILFLVSWRDFHDAGLPSVRVDLVGPRPNQRRALVKTTSHCGVFPSPDKKLVALRYPVSGKNPEDRHRDRILVVNQKGEVAADIDTGK